MLTLEIPLDEYDLLFCDKNRHRGCIACYIRNDLSYNASSNFSSDIFLRRIFWRFFIKTCLKKTQMTMKHKFLMTSTLICDKMDVIYSKNTIYLCATQLQMMLNTTSYFVQCFDLNSSF